jgi:hypothetical protein
VRIAALGNQPCANHFQFTVAGLVIGIAFFLVDRPALRFAPEGAPGLQLALRADLLVEVRQQQGVELGRGGGRGACQRVFPVFAVFGGEIKQRLGQELFLRLKLEVNQPMRHAGGCRHIGHRRLCIAAGSQAFYGGFDHLLAPVFAAGLAGERRGIKLFGRSFHGFHFD